MGLERFKKTAEFKRSNLSSHSVVPSFIDSEAEGFKLREFKVLPVPAHCQLELSDPVTTASSFQ